MLTILLTPDAPPDHASVAEHQPVEFVCPAPQEARLELWIDGLVLEPFLRPGDAAWRWRWNPGAAVGLHPAALMAESAAGEPRRIAWDLRVAPRKIDQERYTALIDDLQRVAAGLVSRLAAPGVEGAALDSAAGPPQSRLEQYYALFEGHLEPLETAVRRIAARPREHLGPAVAPTPLGQAHTLDGATLARLAAGSLDPAPPGVAEELQAALRPEGGLLPENVPATYGLPGFDTYEHRLLKRLLAVLAHRARMLGELASCETVRLERTALLTGTATPALERVRTIAAGCDDATRRLRHLRGLPFLAEVSPLNAFYGPTPLLQRDAAYRTVYRVWLALRRPVLVMGDSRWFNLPIDELPRLYERWCALQVAQTLLALGGEVHEQCLVTHHDDDDLTWQVALQEDAPLLSITRGGALLTLWYQPRYQPARTERAVTPSPAHLAGLTSLDRHTRVPDLAIEIRRPGESPQVLALDAKYRVEPDGRRVPQDALADAYAYLGAIGTDGVRATTGALLLYPGRGTAELYASRVGAVPLLPEATDTLAEALTAYLP